MEYYFNKNFKFVKKNPRPRSVSKHVPSAGFTLCERAYTFLRLHVLRPKLSVPPDSGIHLPPALSS